MEIGSFASQSSEERETLRNNHYANWTKYLDSFKQYESDVKDVKQTVRVSNQTSSHLEGMRTSALAIGSMNAAAYPTDDDDEDDVIVKPDKCPKYSSEVEQIDSSSPDDCFFPGFKVVKFGSDFIGKCSICDRTSIIALVLKVKDKANFMNLNRKTFSRFLSSMDIYDLFYKRICCDACASYLIEPNAGLLPVPVSGAVALLSPEDNMDLWVEMLNGIFSGVRVDIPKWYWVEYLRRKIIELPADDSTTIEERLFKDALTWLVRGFNGEIDGDGDDASSQVTLV
ncbi:uncharacterized protein LY89DRAFT_739890 [Mollisia scopiformis]|uniref:Uncharacterized protein n=1 Tax=Mollisia scopiformis TaxID=149040 RepID=A0A194WTA0_MOLSC|nr:uncharacterized protein LY89DRAFT_739890 [Mollisia scopiformis]KUJ10909.1 hypothetical protein LY89DRAFT_739890 [Mollisia scopiformis]